MKPIQLKNKLLFYLNCTIFLLLSCSISAYSQDIERNSDPTPEFKQGIKLKSIVGWFKTEGKWIKDYESTFIMAYPFMYKNDKYIVLTVLDYIVEDGSFMYPNYSTNIVLKQGYSFPTPIDNSAQRVEFSAIDSWTTNSDTLGSFTDSLVKKRTWDSIEKAIATINEKMLSSYHKLLAKSMTARNTLNKTETKSMHLDMFSPLTKSGKVMRVNLESLDSTESFDPLDFNAHYFESTYKDWKSFTDSVNAWLKP